MTHGTCLVSTDRSSLSCKVMWANSTHKLTDNFILHDLASWISNHLLYCASNYILVTSTFSIYSISCSKEEQIKSSPLYVHSMFELKLMNESPYSQPVIICYSADMFAQANEQILQLLRRYDCNKNVYVNNLKWDDWWIMIILASLKVHGPMDSVCNIAECYIFVCHVESCNNLKINRSTWPLSLEESFWFYSVCLIKSD